MKKTRKIISIILCLTIFLVLIFSIYFISTELKHHCVGENCPICMELHACLQTIETIGTALVLTISFCATLLCFNVQNILYGESYTILHTLVLLKVELLN